MHGVSPQGSEKVNVLLLGDPQIHLSGEIVTAFRSNRILALLGYLAFHRGWKPRELVAEALWPESRSDAGRQSLRQTILYTRQLLGPNSILVSGPSITLNPNISVDVDRILRVQGRPADGPRKIEIAMQALEVRRGPFLESLDDEWLLGARAQLSLLYIVALMDLAEEALPERPKESLAYLSQVIAEEPLLDSARARKIEALRRLGEHAGAHREFQAYKLFLAQELGISPSPIVEGALTAELQTATEPTGASASVDSSGASTDIYEVIQELGSGPRPDQAVDLACAMTPFWISTGTAKRGRTVLEETIARSGQGLRPEPRERAQLCHVELSLAQGDLEQAQKRLNSLHSEPLSVRAQTRALMLSARVATTSFEGAKAQSLLKKAGALAVKHGLVEEELEIHRLRSRLALILDDPVAAERSAAEAVVAAERLEDNQTLAEALLSLAYAQARASHVVTAKETAQHASQAVGEARSPAATAVRTNLTRLREEMGEKEGIEEGYEAGVRESRLFDNTFTLAINLTYLGDYLTVNRRRSGAIEAHSEALALRRALNDRLGIATSLRGLGRAHLGLSQFDLARRELTESAGLFMAVNALPGHASSLLALAMTEQGAGNASLALRLASRAVHLLRALPLRDQMANGPDGLDLLRQAQELEQSLQHSPVFKPHLEEIAPADALMTH